FRYTFIVWYFHPNSLPVCRRTSNNIIQKGLAFGRDRSGTVANSGRQWRPEILPRRLHGRDGALVVRHDAAMNRMEDLDVKVCKASTSCSIRNVRTAHKSCATDRRQS